MPYNQIRVDTRVLSRSRELDVEGMSNGYPAYRVLVGDAFTSVLSILYTDDSGIYLSEDKTFKLVEINYTWFFSADPSLPAFTYSEFIYIPWSSLWANQRNTGPDYNSLVVPVRDVDEALAVAQSRRIPISFSRDVPNNQGRSFPLADVGSWIVPVNPDGTAAGAIAFFNWWPSHDAQRGSFVLEFTEGTWTLRAMGVKGFSNYPQASCNTGGTESDPYVGIWYTNDAYRWITTRDNSSKARVTIDWVGGHTYHMSMKGKRLSQADHWHRLGFICVPPYNIYNGTEFYNSGDANPINIDFMVFDNLYLKYDIDDADVYRLGGYLRFMRTMKEDWGPYDPARIDANLPHPGGYSCAAMQWDGAQLSCYGVPGKPYAPVFADKECTLDAIIHDIHCQAWARENKGEAMTARLKADCINATYNNPPVCNCFLPDQQYYDKILSEFGTEAAKSVQATHSLQCESQLCPNENTLSSNLFYREGMSCNYCINVLNLQLTAKQISSNINIIQTCAGADVTYTWPDLLTRLIDLGAWYNGEGTTKDVMISPDENSIILNILSPKGKEALMQLPILQAVSNKDTLGRIVLTKQIWSGNISSFSRDITIFLLYVRSK